MPMGQGLHPAYRGSKKSSSSESAPVGDRRPNTSPTPPGKGVFSPPVPRSGESDEKYMRRSGESYASRSTKVMGILNKPPDKKTKK